MPIFLAYFSTFFGPDKSQEWVKLVQEQDPHIVIGYNISGFDWEYMFRRAMETGCVDDFINYLEMLEKTLFNVTGKPRN